MPDTNINLQGSSKISMDWLNVGSNGFAQMGDPLYFEKNKIEMSYLLSTFEEKFPVPAELKMLCRYAKKAFSHDFGTYHEIVVHYDDDVITDDLTDDQLWPDDVFKHCTENSLSLPELPKTLFDIFWDWFHQVESFDMETEEITEAIRQKYLASLDTSKAEHLSIVSKRIAS